MQSSLIQNFFKCYNKNLCFKSIKSPRIWPDENLKMISNEKNTVFTSNNWFSKSKLIYLNSVIRFCHFECWLHIQSVSVLCIYQTCCQCVLLIVTKFLVIPIHFKHRHSTIQTFYVMLSIRLSYWVFNLWHRSSSKDALRCCEWTWTFIDLW